MQQFLSKKGFDAMKWENVKVGLEARCTPQNDSYSSQIWILSYGSQVAIFMAKERSG